MSNFVEIPIDGRFLSSDIEFKNMCRRGISGYGAGCAGIYPELLENGFNGNGLKGIDRYGKGNYVFKSGFGDGSANCPNDIKNKGYGKPCNKNCGICKHIR